MANVNCPSCGSSNVEQIDADKYQCPYCGTTFSARESLRDTPVSPSQAFAEEDVPSNGLNWVSLLLPVVGVILYFIKKAETPIAAKSYLKWSLIGWGIWVVYEIIIGLLSY